MDENSYCDSQVYQHLDVDDLWVYDKLIVGKKLQYCVGPAGVDVPTPGAYITRPITNIVGMGIGATIQHFDRSTDNIPPGHFWSEIFTGRHFSVDYSRGEQLFACEGFLQTNTLIRWERWVKSDVKIPFPGIIEHLKNKYPSFCCEFIGEKLIEIHVRKNPDFQYNNEEFIPIWDGRSLDYTDKQYSYVPFDDHTGGRIGAWVK